MKIILFVSDTNARSTRQRDLDNQIIEIILNEMKIHRKYINDF